MKRILVIPLIISLVSVFLLSFSGKDSKWAPGSPGGYSGSPADGQNCTACHNGSASAASNIITSDVPVSGYVAGTVYTFTVTIPGSGKKGFEVSPQTLTGSVLGMLAQGSGTHLTNANKAVTQSSNSSANPAIWSFSWTAPAVGTGPVTFYGAFCVGKSTTKLSTLTIPEFVTGLPELTVTNFRVFPNPARGNFAVNYSLNSPQHISITIYDLCGKPIKLLSESLRQAGPGTENLDLPAGIAAGIYYLQFTTPEKTTTSKIIIH